MDDKALQELIDSVLDGRTSVSGLSDGKFVSLMGGLKRMYAARVMNCVDASARWDKEWLALSSIFDRVTAAQEGAK